MGLARYRTKRDFSATPEPKGGSSEGRLPVFVIQRHRASHLHYDLRLEWGGVLKSWAVPKGPPAGPHDKRLAILVEDHPLAYGTFKGVIPKGNYGAGSVEIWDHGTYTTYGLGTKSEIEKRMAAQFAEGKITFDPKGKRLSGGYALVRLSNPKLKNAWLLMKHHHADPKADPPRVRRTAKDPAPTHPIRPMLAHLADAPFSKDGWIFEVKWDGYRALADIKNGSVSLYSRAGQPFNDRFPDIVASLRTVKGDAVLDGEIVALDADGKPKFQLLQDHRKTGKGTLVYCVFDLLSLDGRDYTHKPLLERKRLLKSILPKRPDIRFSEHVVRDGVSLFRSAQRNGLEGIMAKRADSIYQAGRRSNDWLKMKTALRQEAVIAGYTEPRGSRKYIGALILGVYQDHELRYIGHAGGGSDASTLKDLCAKLKRIERRSSPFARPPKPNAPVHWVTPSLVCEVRFQEWTSDGIMRQPIFLGLREDKPAADVVKEIAHDEGTPIGSGHRAFSFTHRDKVFWPKERITKGDVLAYYRDVAKYLLPHIKGRPESLHRFPNGIGEEGFFQKDLTDAPDWIKIVKVRSLNDTETIHYAVCDDETTLSYLVQLGCIEINPWNSRVGRLDRPDYLILDLDPEGVPFSAVVKTARAVKDVFDGIGVTSHCKTSGATGLHVYVPLGAKYTYEQARLFAELIATRVRDRLPKLTSLERRPEKRPHRVYLDTLQNREGATTVAPYSLRPRPGAPVSTPLHWDEVVEGLDPLDHTIKNIGARLKKVGDLWKPVLGRGIDMDACLRKLKGWD